MPNSRPRKKPAFTHEQSWIDSGNDGTPRLPAIERLTYDFTEEVSLGLRFSMRTPPAELNRSIRHIMTWVLYEKRVRMARPHRERAERWSVVNAWNDGSARKRTRTRHYISAKTHIPDHRVKVILRDWRAFLKVWESSAGVKARRRMKRVVRNGKYIDRRFFDGADRFIILGKRAGDLS